VPIKPWLDRQPRRRPSFCFCSLHGRSQEVPSPKTACSVCSQSLQNKNKPHRNPCVETNLIFSFCPGCELKFRSFVIRKFIHHTHFRIQSKYSLHLESRRPILMSWSSLFNEWSARKPLFLHTNLLLKLFELRRIVFLAGVQRTAKIVRNLLCVAVTLFVSANKTSDLCSTAIRQFNELPPSRWV